MQETILHKAIYNLGSVKGMAKKLGIHREHIYAWIKGSSKIPLEYALQIEYLTRGEVHWKELVAFHTVQRLRHLTVLLPKFDLPPCELVYIAMRRIKCSRAVPALPAKHNTIALQKSRPICVDAENSLIFGFKTFQRYQQQAKRTIPSWRVSLLELAKGSYEAELFVKNFSISERVAVGMALETFLGKRQGQRNDLHGKRTSIRLREVNPLTKLSVNKRSLKQHPAEVLLEPGETLRQLIAKRLGFVSHFTYQSAKKIKTKGSVRLIRQVDQLELAVSTAVKLTKFSIEEQNKILSETKKNILKKALNSQAVEASNHLAIHSKSNSQKESYAL